MKIIAIILSSLLALAVLAAAVINWKDYIIFKPRIAITKGMVAKVDQIYRDTRVYTIDFQLKSGEPRETKMESRVFSHDLEKGDSVEVVYHPDEPQNARANFTSEVYAELMLALLFTVMFLVIVWAWKSSLGDYWKTSQEA